MPVLFLHRSKAEELLDTEIKKSSDRVASLAYHVGVAMCGLWLLVTRASWYPFVVLILASLSALAVFSNRIWSHRRHMHKPFDSIVALVGNTAILALPAVLILTGAELVRCLVALGFYFGVALLMHPPPASMGWKRRRASRAQTRIDGD